MCDFSGKLIAWMDGELSAGETAELKRHLDACLDCRSSVEAYKRVSDEVAAYCDEALAPGTHEGSQLWIAAASAVGAAASLVLLSLVWPRTHVQPREFQVPHAATAESAAVLDKTIDASILPIARIQRRAAKPEKYFVQHQDGHSPPAPSETASYSAPNEPVVEIAIPAEEMFPPGAVPEGMHFVADMTIAADGSAERLQMRPRLAGFERRTIQP